MPEIKTREGWEWKQVGESGYWSKIVGKSHIHKVPFFCPHCKKPCGDVDEKWLKDYGICWECHTLYISDRSTPLIDLSKYKK